MSVIATVSIPAEEFTLGAALAPNPGMRVRLERVVPAGESLVPFLWVANGTVETIETELEREPDVDAFAVVDRVGEEALVRVEWAETVEGFLAVIARMDAALLEGSGEADRWKFRLRFDDRSQLTRFYRRCVEKGVSLDVDRVHDAVATRDAAGDPGLTDPQNDALRLALRRGYFEVPRRTTLVELAEELGVSDSAVSQRLRRGIGRMLAAAFEDATDREE